MNRDYNWEKVVIPDTLKKIAELTIDEKRAVTNYVGTDFIGINNSLRNGYKMTDSQRETVKYLDSALEKLLRYTSNKPLYRSLYFDSDSDITKFAKDKNLGKIFNNKEYIYQPGMWLLTKMKV